MALPAFSARAAEADRAATDYPVGELEPVAAIRQRAEWKQFVILVWQFQTDVLKDAELYARAGLRGFHIDRGAAEEDRVRLSLERGFPYYVDHAAGKGILYLSKEVQAGISRKSTLQVRPHSLADPSQIAALKLELRQNIATTKKGLVYAYAFDDEISLGSFNNPVEVDIHPLSVAWYRKWLAQRYSTIANLNAAWASSYGRFDDVQPVGFGDVRGSATGGPLAAWNLARWMEWRSFMDYQFAQVLADLTRYANTQDAAVPAGFVGAQHPSAYGGFDYGLLARAVQWIEGSDLGGCNEILRSFWNRPRRPQVQTYGVSALHKNNVRQLWNRLAHGNQGTIAWPAGWMRDTADGRRELSAAVERMAPTFREVQGRAGEFIVSADAYLEADPIGIYYSHPSIRAGWVMDSITHGATWPNRSSSLDGENLSSAWLRLSWCKLLEDIGYQYDFINYLDVREGRIELAGRFKVIILPQTICLSDRETQALRSFVQAGGMLIADSLCGIMSEVGRGRSSGSLDDLFGVRRNEARGYLNGRTLTEVDGELHNRPFPQRLRAYDGAIQYRAMTVFERGTRAAPDATGVDAGEAQALIRARRGKGRTLYLNLTPLSYAYSIYRDGKVGADWRQIAGDALRDAGLRPRVEIEGSAGGGRWMESMLWRNGDRYCLAVVRNVFEPVEAAMPDDNSQSDTMQITIRLKLPARGVRNIRTGRVFGDVVEFKDLFNQWEANLYEFNIGAKAL